MQGAEKSQCGYYGITGYNWIFKFLLDKFHSLEPSLVHPLTILEFIQLVLIPEAALVLIAEDYQWNVDKEKKKTLKILASSHEFGNIIHFETNDDILYGLQQFSLA